MAEVSLCIVTSNDAATIGHCLESIKNIVDEIVIVDMASVDNTKDIVSKYTDKVYDFEELGTRADAFNLSFDKASNDFIMWLEPDDVIEEAELEKMIELKKMIDPSLDAVILFHNYTLDQDKDGLINISRSHIVKKRTGLYWKNGIVEYLPVTGKVIKSDVVIINKPELPGSRNFPGIYENLLEVGEKLSSREIYYYACSLYEKNLYEDAGKFYGQFLSLEEGWVGDQLAACYNLSDIYNRLCNRQMEFHFIMKAFEYDMPRAEFCCKLGGYFLEGNKLNMSIAWYQMALVIEKPIDNYGFFYEDCWTWLPHIQLCIAYNKLGQNHKAYEQNELARSLLPDNKIVLQNKQFLEGLLKEEKPVLKSPMVNISKTLEKPLRIVQVAPNVYPIPPVNYGGTEVVIYELTEELVRRGHDVYLYALKDSKTSAKLIPYKADIGMDSVEIMKYVTETLPDNVDVFHYHTYPSIISSKCITIPSLCTIHSPIDAAARNPVYVSKRAMELLCENHGFYVYNGLDFSRYEFSEEKEDYMLFLGRVDREKGVHIALEVAERSHQKLIIAGPIHDYEYYNSVIQARIKKNPNIYYAGSVGGKKKQDLLKHARCVLFPITWEEPFGLVMIEAMACGTPVLAFQCGSVPEVLAGYPEFICSDIDDMFQKAVNMKFPSSQQIRHYVENNFSASIMTDRYLEIYEKLIKEMS